MNRILLASALVLGVSGAAIAQEPPVTVGNYSAAVLQELNHNNDARPAGQVSAFGSDTMVTASVAGEPGTVSVIDNSARFDVAQPPLSNVSIVDDYSGR